LRADGTGVDDQLAFRSGGGKLVQNGMNGRIVEKRENQDIG
jgi:hypothetical protein